MNNNTINNTKFSDTNIKSGQFIKLNKTINLLKILNTNLNNSITKTNEINKIINNKNETKAYLSESYNLINNKTIKYNLVNLLLTNNKNENNTHNSALINKGKYFSIGNKYFSINTFKNLLNNFNLKINTIEKNNESKGKKNLRQYLNLITKFEHKNSQYNLYKFNNTNKLIFAMKKASEFLNLSFNSKGCLISKPTFNLIYTNNKIENEISNTLNNNINKAKIVINLFYFIKITNFDYNNMIVQNKNANVLTNIFEKKFSYLTDYLTKIFNSEVELNLVRLYQPYQDSNILVQYLNSESYTNKFIRLTSRLFKNINLNNNQNLEYLSETDLITNDKNNYFSYPSNISGLNIKLAGRAVNERVIPRLTVKRTQKGSFNRLNAKLIEKSMFTDKTKKGAYSFTVTLSQNFK